MAGNNNDEFSLKDRFAKSGLLYNLARNNLKEAYLIDEGDVDLLLRTTIRNINDDFDGLVAALHQKDWEKFGNIIHNLKGILLNLRLVEQAAFAKELKDCCERFDARKTEELLEKLKNSIEEFLN